MLPAPVKMSGVAVVETAPLATGGCGRSGPAGDSASRQAPKTQANRMAETQRPLSIGPFSIHPPRLDDNFSVTLPGPEYRISPPGHESVQWPDPPGLNRS